jgi:hypothetical protein
MIYSAQSNSAKITFSSIVSWFNKFPLGDEDTIEELSFVFSSDIANLANFSAAERDGSIVDAFEDKLVFDFSSESNSASWKQYDSLVLFTS